MANIGRLLSWLKRRYIPRRYGELQEKLLGSRDENWLVPDGDARLAVVVWRRTGLTPDRFLDMSIAERLPFLEIAAETGDFTPVTIGQVHQLAEQQSASDAPSLKTFQNAGIIERGGVANYYDILPKLREKWPRIPWPSQLSPWE